MPLIQSLIQLRSALAAALALACLAGSAAAQGAPPAPPAAPAAQSWRTYAEAREVLLRDVAAIVVVRPEDRADVAVSITNPGPLRAPEVRVSGRRLIIDGKLRRKIRSCRANGQSFEATIRDVGRLNRNQLPVIELRTPRNLVMTAGGAVRVHVGRAETLNVRMEGCGDADLEGASGAADVVVAGAQELRLYEAGEASIRVAGGGEVVVGVVRNGLDASIAGAGDLVASRVDGPTNIAIQGAGDVTIRDGSASVLSIVIAGAGDVTHNGSAETLDVAIFGGGDVRVRRVDGEITRRVFGGGDISVGR